MTQLYLKTIYSILHKLPSFKGKIRLGSLLIRPWRNKKIEITLNLPSGLLVTVPNLTESLVLHLFINGEYEPHEIAFLNQLIKKNKSKTFLDIGANIGLFSLNLSKNNPGLNIYSIEASPRVFSYLSKNIQQNKLSNINAFQTALSDVEQGEMKFYSDEIAFGTGSLSPVFTKEAEIVPCTTIDHFLQLQNIPTVDLIKIDVEGYELQVFKGGNQLLKKEKSPTILFEFVDWAESMSGCEPGDAQSFLITCGYQLFRLEKDKLIAMKECMKVGSATIIAMKN